MDDIQDLIVKIKERPGMFLTDYSVYSVKAFIDGYTMYKEKDLELMYGFQNYIIDKFNFPKVLSWDKVIRVYSNSDKESMESFFKLFNEFLEQNKEPREV